MLVCVKCCAVRLTGRSCTPDQELQEDLIQGRIHASVRCAVTMPLAIIMESGPARDAKLSSREAFKVTSMLHEQSCCSEYQNDLAASTRNFADIENN